MHPAWQLLLVLLLACPTAARALQPDMPFSQYDRSTWSTEQGLPQSSVNAIAQDHAGYIWFGTQGGLGRLDGVEFTTYTPDTDPGLPGMWINALATGPDGRLWVGTYKGLAFRDDNGFTAVPARDAVRWPELNVAGIAVGSDGTVLAATGYGLFQFDGAALQPVTGLPAGVISDVLITGDVVWASSDGAVHRRDHAGWQTLALPDDGFVWRLVHAQDRLWAATARGLFVLVDDQWRPLPDGVLAGTPVRLLLADGDGNLWAGGEGGLARIRDGRVVELVGPDDPGALPTAAVAIEDREGSIWIGSAQGGAVRLSDSHTRRYALPEGLHTGTVWSTVPDPDGRRVWAGTDDGVAVLEEGRFRLAVPGQALPSPHATSLLAESDRLWIGTLGGLSVLDHSGPHAGVARQLPEFAILEGAYLGGLVRTSDGDLWLLSNVGLFRWNGSELRVYAREDGLIPNHMRFMLPAKDGRHWVGTTDGLFRKQGERFEAVGTADGLPADLDVLSIGQLPGGGLVVGALSERLHFQHAGRWHQAGVPEGFPRNAVFVLQPHDGYLWLSGMEGIARIPLEDFAAFAEGRIPRLRTEPLLGGRILPHGGQFGVCCNGVGNSSGFIAGGVMWVPTDDGLRALDTARLSLNPVPPLLAIDRLQLGDAWQDAATLAGTSLSSDLRDLAFEFAVLSFQDPKSNTVSYRLRGYDTEWRLAEPGVREVRYTNLPGGDYVFEVQGTNNAGVPAAAAAELPFSIGRRFHETGWFPLALAALGFALMYSGYRYQRHRSRLRQAELERLVDQRTEALAESNQQLAETIDQLADSNHQLEQASLTDPLTGLRNRRYLTQQIPADLNYYDRQLAAPSSETVVFAMLDLDHFKQVNDVHGHAAGDRVLEEAAARLQRMVRSGDYVVRWGGEEFLLVFRPMPPSQVPLMGERLRSAIASTPFDIGEGRALDVTASVGLSEYPLFRNADQPLGWEAMIELADQALYYVKRHGRDGWAMFRPTATTRSDTLLADLQRDADVLLGAGELVLHGSLPSTPAGT